MTDKPNASEAGRITDAEDHSMGGDNRSGGDRAGKVALTPSPPPKPLAWITEDGLKTLSRRVLAIVHPFCETNRSGEKACIPLYTYPQPQPAPVADAAARREEIARIIDPHAFVEPKHPTPDHALWSGQSKQTAFAKADAILARIDGAGE